MAEREEIRSKVVVEGAQEAERAYARMAAAVKLFEMGRLTSGQAAQLAGIPRVTFLLSCPQWGVPAVAWDVDEVAAEFKPLAE